MKTTIELYPTWIRVWHWSNALSFLILIATGFSMHFATPGAYLIPFNTARLLHNFFGIVLVCGWLIFVFGNLRGTNGIHYRLRLTGLFRRLLTQALFYGVGIFRGAHHPFPATRDAKFNPLQQVTYWGVMFGAIPLLILSGLAFFFHDWIPEQVLGMDGLMISGVLHYVIGVFLTAFMIGHIYLATAGETVFGEFKKMLFGATLTEEKS
ncbi:MAG: cytochrome b/b6 domain-containing protein [Magnetococcales bacterium]|nr:cytochrome b/b6 domain-containing protein [Magnetococcales bacterium]MBF0439671.1 cytochrome b/b6 domain-containing protein [Magnetococcales bacterium]